jgi:hypothetical protein
MKRIIYTNADGTTSVIVPLDNATDITLAWLAAKDVPAGRPYEIVDLAEIPTDRTLRNIWKHDTSASPAKIGVDMADAKALVLSRLRAIRDASLLELDTEYAIASRTGADTSGLDTQRQTLLDATEALKALDVDGNGIVTPEEAMAALAV